MIKYHKIIHSLRRLKMKKICLFFAIILVFGGCALMAPNMIVDWTGINTADADNIKAGMFGSAYDAVFNGCVDVLKDEGWDIDKADKTGGTITTIKKHGITMYGSTNYAMSCQVKVSDNNKVQVKWSTITYISDFLNNTDMLDNEGTVKWNYLVYKKAGAPPEKAVEEKGNTATAAKAVSAPVPEPAPTATSEIPESELPAPPK
jgi:hypothetical protein